MGGEKVATARDTRREKLEEGKEEREETAILMKDIFTGKRKKNFLQAAVR